VELPHTLTTSLSGSLLAGRELKEALFQYSINRSDQDAFESIHTLSQGLSYCKAAIDFARTKPETIILTPSPV
jgi:hypothetical protein